MPKCLPAQNIIVTERRCEPSVEARGCATFDSSALDECATLAVNDSCGSRNELNCDATRSMPMADIQVENMATGETMVQIVRPLPGQETYCLVCQHRN